MQDNLLKDNEHYKKIDQTIEESDDERVMGEEDYIYRESFINKVQYLEQIRELPFLQRLLRKFKQGSLRGTIITWVRMTVGIGIFSLPFYISQLGVFTGLIFLLLSAFLNYFTFKQIFEIAEITKEKDYLNNVEKVLGGGFYQISRISIGIDYMSTLILYGVACYNFLQNVGYNFGIFDENDLKDIEKMIFNEFTSKWYLIRIVFFSILLIVSFPNLIKKNMESQRVISITFLITMFILLISVVVQLPFIQKCIYEREQWNVSFFSKAPSFKWITSLFSIMFSFNLQIYALDIKNELFYPTLKRLDKINKFATFYEFLLCCFVGLSAYICLGDDYIPKLIVLRNSLDLKNSFYEYYIKLLIFIFFVILVISLPVFNPSARDYLIKLTERNDQKSFYFFSILPTLILCFCSILYPFITDIIDIFGVSVFCYDAYLIPLLMKIKILENNEEKKNERIMLIVLVVTISILCILGLFDIFFN